MRHLTLLRYSGGLFWLTFFVSFVDAQAAPLPAAAGVAPAALRWGAQGGTSEVSVDASETGVKLRVGKLQVPLALPAVRTLQTEMVQLKGGVSVGIVRVSGEHASAATLIVKRPNGTLEALWTGLTQLTGDRGERQAQAIEVGDRDGDGAADVVVGTYDERIQICGQERTLLSPRALDPKSLTLKSVLLNRSADRTPREQLAATTTAPVVQTPAVLRGLHVVGASSALQEPGRSPAAVTDGDLSTAWLEGRGLGGRFEFVTMRWAAPGRTIRAVAVVPVPMAPTTTPATGAPEAHARVLSLLGDKGERLIATLPEDPRPGQRYWIVPSAPLDWSCLTVSIDDVFPGTIGPKTHAGIAEVEAYTDLDFAGGLDKLVAELAQDGPNGDNATQQLASARGDVVAAMIATWPRLSPLGKRRALRVLFAPQHPDPRSTQLLRSAMRDADKEVNQRAIELARSRVEGGPALLLELAHDPAPQGDQAALALAHSTDPNAFSGLLTVLLDERGSERPILRDALLLAYRATGADAAHALARWLGDEPGALSPTPPPVAARAALALALSNAPESQAAALSLFQRTRDESREFSDQWRLVQAASTLASEANGDAWLARLAHDADPWMLRMAALAALDARHATAAPDVARQALADDYPRVRANALKVLAVHSPDVELLSGYARDDKWFLVRIAALEALPDSPAAHPVMLAAVGDRTPAVRATAVRVLQRARVPGAWNRIKPLLDNREEYPEVIAEGIAFAKALCIVAATPDLEAVAERGLKPDAWTPDQELAVTALEALSAFGGSAAAWARDHAVGSLVPKQLHDAAAAAAEKPGTCGTSPVL